MSFKPQIKKLDYYQAGITDHNALANLAVGDPHSQYALLAGRAGGQIMYFGNASGNGGSIRSTSHATKGKIKIADDGGSVEFGSTPSNLGFVNINPGTSAIPAVTINQTPSSNSDIVQVWRANVQKVLYVDQYGITRINQPANANYALEVTTSAYTGSMNAAFSNTNTGAFAGFVVAISTSGGGVAAITLSANNLNWGFGGAANRGIRSVLTICAEGASFDTAAVNNVFYTAYTQGSGNAGETSEYNRQNTGIGSKWLSADALGVMGGDFAVINPNTYGGGLGPEILADPTIASGSGKWSFSGDASQASGAGALFGFSAGNGYISQTAANMVGALKNSTYYLLAVTYASGVVGTNHFMINDPNGTYYFPVSVQHSQSAWQKFTGINSSITRYYVFKTHVTGVAGLPFALKGFLSAAGATFKISNISLKEIIGGNAAIQGKLKIREGADASMGQATLIAGTVTVNTTKVTANSRIFVTIATPGGTIGILSIGAITAGTSFVINSSSALDTSVVNWMIIDPIG